MSETSAKLDAMQGAVDETCGLIDRLRAIVAKRDERIAELEDKLAETNTTWLEWSESRGPGLAGYRELGARCAELEDTLENRDERLAEMTAERDHWRKVAEGVV